MYAEQWVLLLLAIVCALGMSGCTYVMGPKQTITHADGTEIINYVTGVDLAMGINGIDEVHNQRGIRPGENKGGR